MSDRRHFTTEAEVMAELERLHFAALEASNRYASQAVAAAEAEAIHKATRAKRVLLAKAREGVRSIQEAQYVAEADEEVAQAYMDRLTTAAVADSTREAMRTMRTNQEALRTMAASYRPTTP